MCPSEVQCCQVCHQSWNFDKRLKLYLWINIYSSDRYCIARMQCSFYIKLQLHTNHQKGFGFWWKLRVLQCLECVLQCVGFNVEAKNISQHWEPGARQPGGNPGKGGQANGQWPPLLDCACFNWLVLLVIMTRLCWPYYYWPVLASIGYYYYWSLWLDCTASTTGKASVTYSSQYRSLPEQYLLNLCTIAGQPLELCKSALSVWGGGRPGS